MDRLRKASLAKVKAAKRKSSAQPARFTPTTTISHFSQSANGRHLIRHLTEVEDLPSAAKAPPEVDTDMLDLTADPTELTLPYEDASDPVAASSRKRYNNTVCLFLPLLHTALLIPIYLGLSSPYVARPIQKRLSARSFTSRGAS